MSATSYFEVTFIAFRRGESFGEAWTDLDAFFFLLDLDDLTFLLDGLGSFLDFPPGDSKGGSGIKPDIRLSMSFPGNEKLVDIVKLGLLVLPVREVPLTLEGADCGGVPSCEKSNVLGDSASLPLSTRLKFGTLAARLSIPGLGGDDGDSSVERLSETAFAARSGNISNSPLITFLGVE